jgi:hypothetical protein
MTAGVGMAASGKCHTPSSVMSPQGKVM